jgi:hypothetical protein
MRTCQSLTIACVLTAVILQSSVALTQEYQGCAQVKSTAKFFSDELKQQVILSTGRILPFRRTTKTSQIEVYYKTYWIKAPAEAFSFGPKNSCFVQQPCARVTSPTGLYKDIQTKPQKITTAIEKEQFPITGVQQVKGKTFYQVDLGDDFAWILANKVEYKKESCGLAQQSGRSWNIQVEIGQGSTAWRNQYSSVWRKDFASQDLTTARDPILVPQGANFQRLEARWVKRWKPKHFFSVGAEYSQRTWLLRQYADFRTGTGNCRYPDPIVNDRTHQDSLTGISLGYQWQAWEKTKWSLQFVSAVYAQYVINNQFSYRHKIPCATLKNATETTADWEFGGQLGFQWLYRFSNWASGLGIYVNDQMKPFVGIILQF